MFDVQRLLTNSTTELVTLHARCNSWGNCHKALDQGDSCVTAELASLHHMGVKAGKGPLKISGVRHANAMCLKLKHCLNRVLAVS